MTMTGSVLLFPFISRPSAGKGTQTELLSQREGMPRLDMGSMLRAIAKEESDLGRRVESRLSKGQLVELPIVMEVFVDAVEKRLAAVADQPASHQPVGLILDGFPRNQEQATELFTLCEVRGYTIGQAIYLDVPTEVIVERAANRRICQNCGAIYNLVSKPPSRPGICDVCGSHDLAQRKDDQPEQVQARLRSFDEETEPVLALFEAQGVLARVDGNRPIDAVYASIQPIVRAVLAPTTPARA